MNDLTLLLLIAAVGYGIARWLRMPVIPLLIIPGMALSTLGVGVERDFLRTAIELGLMFLMFASGIELNPGRFTRSWRAVAWVGLIQFFIAGAAAFGVALWLDYARLPALYIACALATSSTLVVLRHLKQQQQMFEPFGRLVTGVLLLQDLLLILIIVILAGVPGGWVPVVGGVLGTLALFAVAVFCQRKLMPLLVTRLKLDEETLLLSILATLFLFIAAAVAMRLPPIAGAFLGGFALSAFPINGLVRGVLGPLRDFFTALFFTALGLIVSVPDAAVLLQGLVLAVMVIVITPPLVTIAAEWTGLSSRSAIESGLLLAQISELSLVLLLNGLLLGHVTPEIFSLLALVTVLTMSFTPFFATDAMTERLLHWHPMHRRPAAGFMKSGHVLLLGFGAGGMWIVKPLRDAGHDVLVVDDDPAVIRELQKAGIPWIYGDGSETHTLEQAGARQARVVIAAMRRINAAERVLNYVAGTPVIVRVFESSHAERVKALGGTPVLNSLAAADKFMEWFGARSEDGGRLCQPSLPDYKPGLH